MDSSLSNMVALLTGLIESETAGEMRQKTILSLEHMS